jgi:hypothetical protein
VALVGTKCPARAQEKLVHPLALYVEVLLSQIWYCITYYCKQVEQSNSATADLIIFCGYINLVLSFRSHRHSKPSTLELQSVESKNPFSELLLCTIRIDSFGLVSLVAPTPLFCLLSNLDGTRSTGTMISETC